MIYEDKDAASGDDHRVLIVTPAFGSMPEPRPQQLITGDRAIKVLDTASSAALQAAGVKVATVSKKTYDELVAELTPEDFAGLDPNTGVLKPEFMPNYLSQSAINALNLLDINHTVASQYLPSWLTQQGIQNTIASSSAVQFDTDADGTPVVLGGTVSGGTSVTYSGTITGGTVSAGTLHGDLITGTLGQIATVESSTTLYDNQSTTPGAPASAKTKVYVNSNSRLSWLDATGALYTAKSLRTVTSLPAGPASQLGDEVIVAATGEHRIYKGSTIGWVLASPLSVADVAARDALTNLYPGMRVYVVSSGQTHEYRSDSVWHGSKSVFITGGGAQGVSSVNDTNFRTWSITNIADPGYPYRVRGRVSFEVASLSAYGRVEVWQSIADYSTGKNGVTFAVDFLDIPAMPYRHFHLAPVTNFDITGAKTVVVSWRALSNYTNTYSGNYQAYCDWEVVPV